MSGLIVAPFAREDGAAGCEFFQYGAYRGTAVADAEGASVFAQIRMPAAGDLMELTAALLRVRALLNAPAADRGGFAAAWSIGLGLRALGREGVEAPAP